MVGRPRLPIGTFGEITTREVAPGRYRAATRYRDEDGQTRQIIATGASRNSAKTELKQRLAERQRIGDASDSLTPDSPFPDLAAAWFSDVQRDSERSDGTKEVYGRALRSLITPAFRHNIVREITVGRVERFLKEQQARSYARAKQSRTILSMIMGFAVRREIIARNPVKETSPLRKPKRTPKALSADQISAIRTAAREYRTGEGVHGPRPDGQVRDLIEVMLGTATRIGEALALRKCDVDMAASPPTVQIAGTVVALTSFGVIRQPKPKTDESSRIIAVPPFAAEVIRRRLGLLAGADEHHLLFSTRSGTPLAPHNVRRTFREILKSAGLEHLGITPHAFRRTGATLLANELNIECAAEYLGHTSTATTKESYAEPARSVNVAAAQLLERLAPGTGS